MSKRHILLFLSSEIQHSPAVALLGPRQVGKTTLALEAAKSMPSIYLDLESERDRAKLAQPELYLADHFDKLVILDEVHRAPKLFPVLLGLIDQARRSGKRAGQYLLLGSASLELLQQSGETLAGRIAYLERDIPQLGPRIAADTLRRLWRFEAHTQMGGVPGQRNVSTGARHPCRTAGRAVRQLEPTEPGEPGSLTQRWRVMPILSSASLSWATLRSTLCSFSSPNKPTRKVENPAGSSHCKGTPAAVCRPKAKNFLLFWMSGSVV